MGKGSSNSISSGIHHPNHQTAETGWSTFWKSIWGSNRISFNEQENDYIDDTSPLGKIWDSFTSSSSSDTMSPQDAFRSGTMKSLSGQVSSQHPRLAVRNASSLPLIMCWLNSNCKPHHFYTIEPQGMLDDAEFQIHYDNHNNNNNNSGSKKRKRSSTSYNNIVTSKDKIENTRVGHSFCFATEYELNEETGEKYLSPDKIIGGYRPMRSCSIPNVRNEQSFHLLTITSSSPSSFTRNGNFLKMSCCGMGSTGGGGGGLWGSLRGTTRKENNIVTTVDDDENDDELEWIISVREGIIDPTPIDTSKKHYDECMLSDWPVRLETNWNEDDDDLKEDLCNDLKALRTYLPKHACDVLTGNTPLWINRSLQYGPKLCPVQARACCFHPGGDWLRENGMNPQKEQCVEVYRSSEYKHDRLLWGVGGVLLHEYSHAYHFKCLPDGYDNTDIRECYEKAMEEGLYVCVPYHCAHHSDDKDSDDYDDDDDKSKHVAKAKAYACTNQMEYFAELSAAFLGGLNETEEFNKWYPFNRQQLKKHDPRAYKLLCRLWKVNDDDNDNTDDDEAKEMEEDENAN